MSAHPGSSRPREARPRRPGRGGFTLVELMVVIAIIVIITAIVVPSYRVMSAQSRRNTCAANLKAIGQALALFREDYGCFPPDSTEWLPIPADPDDPAQAADVTRVARDAEGHRVATGYQGLGLYTLYYLGAYASALPPVTLEPPERLGTGPLDINNRPVHLREKLEMASPTPKGLSGLTWFRSAGYITKLDAYHCPENQTPLPERVEELQLLLTTREKLPTLGGWNNYDVYYRRNFWHPGTDIVPPWESRHLLQPYPPVDTVVCWCPHHRSAKAPPRPGVAAPVNPGDKDLVLFADGSVRQMASREDNRMWEVGRTDSGWPAGPIM